MTEVGGTPYKLVINRRVIIDKKDRPEYRAYYEGDLPLTTQQVDALKAFLGDGQGRVTISRELGENDYGNGGKVFVSISLACDQSHIGLENAARHAASYVAQYLQQQHAELIAQLQALGIATRQ